LKFDTKKGVVLDQEIHWSWAPRTRMDRDGA
jgi:hypothetical protein